MGSDPIFVGLISDTHGLLRPEALDALQGSDFIVHAGDIGAAEVLQQLSAIAPVTAVRGNNDLGAWAQGIPEIAYLQVQAVRFLVLHDIAALPVEKKGCSVVVTGHSHKPKAERRDGVLFINPGSAGPRRFKLPISLGRLRVSGEDVQYELVTLVS
jgi:putative phosphoesterase